MLSSAPSEPEAHYENDEEDREQDKAGQECNLWSLDAHYGL
jgi:hypothetical protein